MEEPPTNIHILDDPNALPVNEDYQENPKVNALLDETMILLHKTIMQVTLSLDILKYSAQLSGYHRSTSISDGSRERIYERYTKEKSKEQPAESYRLAKDGDDFFEAIENNNPLFREPPIENDHYHDWITQQIRIFLFQGQFEDFKKKQRTSWFTEFYCYVYEKEIAEINDEKNNLKKLFLINKMRKIKQEFRQKWHRNHKNKFEAWKKENPNTMPDELHVKILADIATKAQEEGKLPGEYFEDICK